MPGSAAPETPRCITSHILPHQSQSMRRSLWKLASTSLALSTFGSAGGWRLQQGAHIAAAAVCRTQPWLLHDGAGTVTHRGHLEGGLGGASSSAGYFVLIKEGNAFTALPAEQFYTFRQKQKCVFCAPSYPQ